MSKDSFGGGKNRGAVGSHAVERAPSGKAFDLSAVEQPGVDPLGKIVERLEPAIAPPLVDEQLHRLLPDALERAKGVAHRMPVAMLLHREFGLARVDIRRKAGHIEAAHILDED